MDPEHALSQQGLLDPCNVFDPWVRWEKGSGWDLSVPPAVPAASGNVEFLKVQENNYQN